MSKQKAKFNVFSVSGEFANFSESVEFGDGENFDCVFQRYLPAKNMSGFKVAKIVSRYGTGNLPLSDKPNVGGVYNVSVKKMRYNVAAAKNR